MSIERDRNPFHIPLRLRICVYSVVVVVMLGYSVVEMKFGIKFGRSFSVTQAHGPRTWEEVLALIPGDIPHIELFVAVLVLIVLWGEWHARRVKRHLR
jgi:hypothetical protein